MGSLLYDGLTLPEFGRGLLDFGLVFIYKKKKRMYSLLLHVIIRTKYSILLHIDLPAIPGASESRTSKLDWLNDKWKKGGLILFNTDKSCAVRSDTALVPRSPPVYVPTSNRAAATKAPRSVSFREITRAISPFVVSSAIHPLENNQTAKSHQYYEALSDNLSSSILVHNETRQGTKFISGEPNLMRKNIIPKAEKNKHAANHSLSPWELTLLAAKEFGSEVRQ